ncbi:hypothetical protein AN401_10255 [Zobellella denitrificans]|uniref:Uncharacterized protein n=1 Tax=Zobellella denitrificans TaxID=347534 RepID=A0A291HQ44_9GAMM|nr:hypothetical protein AN401_10255 [Zobellella denitrificans]
MSDMARLEGVVVVGLIMPAGRRAEILRQRKYCGGRSGEEEAPRPGEEVGAGAGGGLRFL